MLEGGSWYFSSLLVYLRAPKTAQHDPAGLHTKTHMWLWNPCPQSQPKPETSHPVGYAAVGGLEWILLLDHFWHKNLNGEHIPHPQRSRCCRDQSGEKASLAIGSNGEVGPLGTGEECRLGRLIYHCCGGALTHGIGGPYRQDSGPFVSWRGCLRLGRGEVEGGSGVQPSPPTTLSGP